MLGVFEALVPIIASSVFTKLYNATSELEYPWTGSYYFGTIGVVITGRVLQCCKRIWYLYSLGMLLTIFVYLSNGGKQIVSEESEDDKTKEDLEISEKL